MKDIYDVQKYKEHVPTCKGARKTCLNGAGSFSLKHLAKTLKWHQKNPGSQTITSKSHSLDLPPNSHKFRCPGLSEADNTRISDYLERAGASGGGGHSIHTITKGKYNKAYCNLTAREKHFVDDLQRLGYQWHRDSNHACVYSTKCLDEVESPSPSSVSACHQCKALLLNCKFLKALRVPKPLPQNYKYVNFKYRHEVYGKIFA